MLSEDAVLEMRARKGTEKRDMAELVAVAAGLCEEEWGQELWSSPLKVLHLLSARPCLRNVFRGSSVQLCIDDALASVAREDLLRLANNGASKRTGDKGGDNGKNAIEATAYRWRHSSTADWRCPQVKEDLLKPLRKRLEARVLELGLVPRLVKRISGSVNSVCAWDWV